ncbi:MAG TPA: hypothetical protein VM487_04300, partial [Phycisphaerae bacterium]|nr:hypothetical protein [Phycisphaerae bacterium]
SIWALFVVLTVLARRDRRLLYRLPVIVVGVVAALCLARAVFEHGFRGTQTAEFDSSFFHLMLALAGGAAIPALCSWAKAGLARDLPRLARALRGKARWVAACLVLALAAAAAYYVYGLALARHGAFAQYDLLFDADPVRYIRLLEGTASPYEQIVQKHPLFALLERTAFFITTPIVGTENAPILVSASAGGLSLALAAEYFRLITRSQSLALALAASLGVTSGHLVFAATPETYAVSAAVLILLHLLVARGPCRGVRFRHELLAAVLATGVATTHVVVAGVCFAIAHLRTRRWRRLLRWLVCLPTVLAVPLVLQSVLVPNAVLREMHVEMSSYDLRFLEPGVLAAPGHALGNVARGVFAESVVGFTPDIRTGQGRPTALAAGPYSGALARLCVFIWAAGLLSAAIVVLARRGLRRPTFWAALLCLGSTGVFHLFYGNDCIFLYSCTFTFYLFAVVAHAAASVSRRWLTPAVIAFGLLLLVNNVAFLGRVLQALDSLPKL